MVSFASHVADEAVKRAVFSGCHWPPTRAHAGPNAARRTSPALTVSRRKSSTNE
jgi:hypothetical protein